MAGSFKHVVDADGKYRGIDLLENMGDMHEAIEQMAFMLLMVSKTNAGIVRGAETAYYECCRGERRWPSWFQKRD